MGIQVSISVIVPVLNEEKLIKDTVTRIDRYLKSKFDDYEIIVVNDGSRDRTALIVSELKNQNAKIKLVNNDVNRGKGFSVKEGMLAAHSDYVLFSDADLSTPIEELDKFISYMQQGFDVIIGSRMIKGADLVKKQGVLRRLMGRVFNLLVQVLLFRGIIDTQCGFKCFKRECGQRIVVLQRLERFCFDVELLFLARKAGYTIKEVPIRWLNREDSRVGIFTDSLSMFLDLFVIRLNDLKGKYAIK